MHNLLYGYLYDTDYNFDTFGKATQGSYHVFQRVFLAPVDSCMRYRWRFVTRMAEGGNICFVVASLSMVTVNTYT